MLEIFVAVVLSTLDSLVTLTVLISLVQGLL